jgi:cell division protein FtsQ
VSDALDLGTVEPVARGARWRLAGGALLLVMVFAMPWWGPPALARLAFFRVRKIEIIGARFTPKEDILSRLQLDSSKSVWAPLGPLAARVRTHPQLLDAVVTRKLPGTIVVQVTERRPVGLVSTTAGLRAIDERGVQLPLDPSRTPVDAPVVAAARGETTVYHLLGALQREAPGLYARVSSIRAAGGGELLIQLAGLPVRTMTTVTLARLADIEPVERDLARRQLRAAELDLRYRDQVIARLP